MKRAIQNKKELNTIMCKHLMIALLMSVSYICTAQVDCNVTMACNDLVQVSLDDQCEATILADITLEDPDYDNDAYEVTIKDMDGNLLPSNVVSGEHIGMTLEVTVTLIDCDNSCSGNIIVEDKLPPIIMCENVTVACDESTEPSMLVPEPTIDEPCGGPVDIDYFDTMEDLPCSEDFARIITRTYTVTDASGNSATCTQEISVERADLGDVVFPDNRDGDELPMIDCSENFPIVEGGAPDPSYTGLPTGIDCPNIQFYYTDVLFEVCGAGLKVVRQFVVIDWCTGEEAMDNQIIKVVDDTAPTCMDSPNNPDVISNDPGLCTGTYTVPAPVVVEDCSEWDYEVAYKLKDDSGDPYDNPSTENVVRLPNGLYQIPDLPTDTTWIIYTLTDACGNSSSCFSEVVVVDDEAPNAICEGSTVVSLDDQGTASVFATSIDDNSFDNCSDVTVMIRRLQTPCGEPSDLEFGESVSLCCEDVPNSPIQVVLQVTDEMGNVNECIANVNVQDKFPPQITCPATVDLVCGQDYEDMSLTGGMATAEDNCGVTVEFLGYNTDGLNDCGIGVVFKNFRVTDPQGRSEECSQRVNINNPNPFSETDVLFPADLDLNTCAMGDLDPGITGLPTISNDVCANIAISYSDQVFQQVDGLCFKILRTWRVVDWCNEDVTSDNFITGVQKLSISNSIAPTFTASCANQTVEAINGECQANVDVAVAATDDCTPDNQLEYSYTIDYGDDGSVEVSQDGRDASGVYPTGTHRVTFSVIDQCENVSQCSAVITVIESVAPTPICHGEVITVLDENGQAEIWATDFNLKSEDNCDGFDLTYSFNAEGNQPSLAFDCDDILNGVAEEIELNLYVFDASGNSDFCTVILELQDSPTTDACEDNGMGNIQGRIVNENLEGLPTLNVDLFEMDVETETMKQSSTDEEGTYGFSELPYFDSYMVKPESSGDHANGVSTLDLVLIQRHILGLGQLDSPQKIIAADINNSNSVSAVDIVELRKVVLGVREEFSNNTAWKFVPTTHEFEDAAYPWNYPTQIELDTLTLDEDQADFYAIKVGDVNGTATASYISEESSTRDAGLVLSAIDATYTRNETVNIPLVVNESTTIEGMQFTISFDDSKLSFVGVDGEKASVLAHHISTEYADRGLISISYDHVMGLALDTEDVLMSLQFTAKSSGEVSNSIKINSELISAEAYTLDHSITGVSLEIRDEYKINLQKSSMISTPNPFTEETTITFTLATDAPATIRVLDVSGKVVLEVSDAYTAGTNQVKIQASQLSSAGIYYYQLETENNIITKKMIMIK